MRERREGGRDRERGEGGMEGEREGLREGETKRGRVRGRVRGRTEEREGGERGEAGKVILMCITLPCHYNYILTRCIS